MLEGALIGPRGRRLSIEEQVLQEDFNLPHDVFQHLVERRLLRTDRRADSTYYELSHDSLVQPILESHRTRAMAIGFLARIGGVVSAFYAVISAIAAALVPFAFLFSPELGREKWLGLAAPPVYASLAIGFGFLAKKWFRYSRRTRLRYRRRPRS